MRSFLLDFPTQVVFSTFCIQLSGKEKSKHIQPCGSQAKMWLIFPLTVDISSFLFNHTHIEMYHINILFIAAWPSSNIWHALLCRQAERYSLQGQSGKLNAFLSMMLTSATQRCWSLRSGSNILSSWNTVLVLLGVIYYSYYSACWSYKNI